MANFENERSNGPGEVDPDRERERFFRLNIERIEQEYLQAEESGMESPVVLLMDARDETAQRVIAAVPDLAGTGEIADENPASIFTMSADDVISRLEEVHPPIRLFIEHSMKMREAIGAGRRFAVLLMVSFGKIECKLHSLPE